MKNFLDITGIDTQHQLRVNIDLCEHHGAIYDFFFNEIPVLKNTDSFCVDLLSPLFFRCTVLSGAVEIVKITINELEILPKYQHIAVPATAWITTDWQFTIPEPFYPWYHQITGQGWIA